MSEHMLDYFVAGVVERDSISSVMNMDDDDVSG